MRHILGGVFVGVLISGLVSGATVPFLPPSLRHPWVVWLIAGLSIAASVYVASRLTKTPPE